jgi:hypothetical protein
MNDSTVPHAPIADTPLPAVFAFEADLAFPTEPSAGAESLLATMRKGWIQLDGDILRRLRLSRYMSQQDLANDCWHRDIRVSIATIKRAECGHPVRFRIARELARCFGVPVEQLLRLSA